MANNSKLRYDAGSGTDVRSPIPPRRLPLALTGPYDQRREPANKRKPDHQHKDHRSSFLLQVEARALPGLSRSKLWCFSREPVLPLFMKG